MRDCTAELATQLEVPSALVLIIRSVGEDGEFVEREVRPRPISVEILQTQNAFDEAPNIRGQVKRWSVKGVSKRYTREELARQDYDYIIRQSGSIDVVCRLSEIKLQTLTWDLILEQKLGEQQWGNNVRRY